MNIERRFLPQSERCGVRLEKRADAGEDSLPDIVGMGAVYYNSDDPGGTQYQLYDNVFERILPGAFDEAVSRDDVRGLQNHDPRLLLGRTRAKTLSLELTKTGLAYRIQTPNTTAGRDTVESLKRGDIDGSSFAFAIERGGVEWTQEEREVDGAKLTLYFRNLKKLRLFDVGPVTYPAYSGTSSGTRSPGVFLMDFRSGGSELANIRTEHDEFLRRTVHEPAAAERARRLRLAELGCLFS